MAHRNTGGDDLTDPPHSPLSPAASDFPQNGRGRRICVFCGSSHGIRPAYAGAARRLGQAIGEKGHTLVFGGGALGLMGEVARAAR
jgi:predicted Rossmann-fold nucleotide-binding protein